jgi:hypothetical protein
LVFGVYLQVIGDSFDLGNGLYRYGHQRTIAAIQRVAPPLEIPEGGICDLDPPLHKSWVNACLILCNLPLEAYFFRWIKQVQSLILWRDNDLFFDSWSPINALLTPMSCLSYGI